MSINPRSGLITLLAVALAACGPSAETRRRTDSAVAAAARERTVTQAGEVMAARLEAQPFIDSARAAFVAKKPSATAKQLRGAAMFARRQADSASEPARTALFNSADEMDRLAVRIDRRGLAGVSSVKSLDIAFARSQLAEAELHYMRALVALDQAKPGAASSEMIMLSDHLERAAKDARVVLSPSTQATVTTTRTIAAKLAQGTTLPRGDVDPSLQGMAREVQELRVRISKVKT